MAELSSGQNTGKGSLSRWMGEAGSSSEKLGHQILPEEEEPGE